MVGRSEVALGGDESNATTLGMQCMLDSRWRLVGLMIELLI